MGCILFGESQGADTTRVVEFYSLKQFDTLEEAGVAGDSYLDEGGDSYIVLGDFNGKISWDKTAKKMYLEALKNLV